MPHESFGILTEFLRVRSEDVESGDDAGDGLEGVVKVRELVIVAHHLGEEDAD